MCDVTNKPTSVQMQATLRNEECAGLLVLASNQGAIHILKTNFVLA